VSWLYQMLSAESHLAELRQRLDEKDQRTSALRNDLEGRVCMGAVCAGMCDYVGAASVRPE
jgi:hypothetical protein